MGTLAAAMRPSVPFGPSGPRATHAALVSVPMARSFDVVEPEGSWHRVGTLADRRIDEASGIAASRHHADIVWTHNDSGDGPRVFGITPDGATRLTVRIGGARAIDWEDIALGPAPVGREDGRDWLYVADTGGNKYDRPFVTVYRLPEPDPARGDHEVRAEAIHIRYADGIRRDVEALLVDPRSGDLLLVTKQRDDGGAVMVVERDRLRPGGTVLAHEVATLPSGVRVVTGGDVRPDGAAIALRSYHELFTWDRRSGETIAQALRRAPTVDVAPDQSEAITWAADGASLLSVPEGVGAPISRYVPVPAPGGHSAGSTTSIVIGAW